MKQFNVGEAFEEANKLRKLVEEGGVKDFSEAEKIIDAQKVSSGSVEESTREIYRGLMPIEGQSFINDEGVEFRILKGKEFPLNVMDKHREYLSTVSPGMLVSVPFYGNKPTPLIVVGGAVVKLEKIEIKGVILTAAVKISEVLDITDMKQPSALYLA